jgi:DNA-directed RNA polymerase specialized sigma subunit
LDLQEVNDITLIEKVKRNADSEALMELVDRHSGIYLSMVTKYTAPMSSQISRDDLIESKDSYIYDAVMNYNPDKGAKFSTYLGNSTKWHCLNRFKKNKKRSFFTIDEINDVNSKCLAEHDSNYFPELVSPSGEKNLTNREVLDIVLQEVEDHPDSRIKTIFDMRYRFKDRSSCLTAWKDIANELELSIQGTIDIHNKFIEQIRINYEL